MSKSQFKEYWASVAQDEIAHEILDKVDKYFAYLSLSGRLQLYQRSYDTYYRALLTGGRLNPAGEQGELTTMSVGDYKNLVDHLEIMTTQQRATFECVATNSDTKSQAQTILGASLLDYYMGQKHADRNLKKAVKQALLFAEAFVVCGWNPTSGEIYGQNPSTGAPVYQGDLFYKNYTPLTMVRDFTKTTSGEDTWFITRDFEDKYTLAAKFPDLEEDILGASDDQDAALTTLTNFGFVTSTETDNVVVYTLIHKPTPAMPQGRLTTCLGSGTVMLDGPLPYRSLGVSRIAAGEQDGSPFGYTVAYDLLATCEGIDALYSAVISNQLNGAVNNILVPKGHDLSTSQMSGGLNVMEYDKDLGAPSVMQMTNTPPEVFNFIGQLERKTETTSGVSSTARGNPEASLKSGAALALVQSMAIQFNMGLQQSYVELVESVGSCTIEILQDFATVPRIAEIVGKSNRPLMKEFKGEDLSSIKRVRVDMGNPMTKTLAGRVNLAENMMQNNMIEDPNQYIQVLTTGRLDLAMDHKQSQNLLMKAENEMLADGIPQRAVIIDFHQEHIKFHSTVLASPEARLDPNSPIMVATLNHIQEHIDFLQTAPPLILAINGQQSSPPAGQNPQNGGAMQNQDPTMQAAGEVNMPNMPSPPENTDPASAAIIEGNQ